EGTPSFDTVRTPEAVTALFEQYFPDALPLLPTLQDDYRRNPVSSLITTKIYPWVYQDNACLIGDAAHAIVPSYGEGVNAGFEDCTVLYRLMEQFGEDWNAIFSAYQSERKANGDAVADLALINFIEMRDRVADPVFLERKKIEKELGRLYPA